MSTRERSSRPRTEDPVDEEFAFVSDADIEAYLAEQAIEDEEQEKPVKEGFWNLQTASGMGLIGLGVLYSLQQIGWLPLATGLLSSLMGILPVLASVLIILTGFGVLSWSPGARRRRKQRERAARLREKARRAPLGRPRGGASSVSFEQAERVLKSAGRLAGKAASATAAAAGEAARTAQSHRRQGRRLTRDYRNRKLTGLAAGMANYFGLDPTVVRMAWVAAMVFTSGSALVPYILLSMLLPRGDEEENDDDDRRGGEAFSIRITRD